MRHSPGFLLLALMASLVAVPVAHAQTVTWNSVQLSWTTPGDDSLTGTAAQFDLRYSTSPITASNFNTSTRWSGTPAPAPSGTRQSVTVTGLTPSTTYHFAIKTADEVPNWALISNIVSRTTLSAPDTTRPESPIVTVTVLGETSVRMNWNATGDDSLTGTASSYDIRYSTSPITDVNWSQATQVTGEPVPGSPGTSQSYTVTGLSRQTTYYFAMKVADDAGLVSALSNVPSATTPDQMPPAAIRDLVVGFVWFGWHGNAVAMDVRPARALAHHAD
ncbi:MAG TPA: fibronectin type III domain-containing protein [Candidatus Limnocylindria bacterium]|nr:fibronectin type III domain-containing protein [Candidatus Limnocylindria bacterium]